MHIEAVVQLNRLILSIVFTQIILNVRVSRVGIYGSSDSICSFVKDFQDSVVNIIIN